MFIKSLAMSVLFLTSTVSFGQATYENIPTGVFTKIEAEAVNGGINPEYVGVRLYGTIKAGSNPCEGRAYRLSLKKKMNEYGSAVLVPKLKQRTGFFCPKYLDLTYAGISFDTTVIVRASELESTFVAHVGKRNHLVSLEFLVNANAPVVTEEPAVVEPEPEVSSGECNERVFCTMEFNPTTCTYRNETFSGSNPCQALSLIHI